MNTKTIVGHVARSGLIAVIFGMPIGGVLARFAPISVAVWIASWVSILLAQMPWLFPSAPRAGADGQR